MAASEIVVVAEHRESLLEAFRDRLGLVDAWPGFRRLEVWADQSDATRFTMVSWWDAREDFVAYMRSPDHQSSHQRERATDEARPAGFRRFLVVSR